MKGEIVIAEEDNGQKLLGFIEANRKTGKQIIGYEYAVLVTNLEHEILALGQLYRDRADAENAFDELKNKGAGADSPQKTSIVANSLPELWH